MNKYDVIQAAMGLVEDQLAMLETLCEARQYRMKEESRLICRCRSCRDEIERTAAWMASMRAPVTAAAQPRPNVRSSSRAGQPLIGLENA